MGQRTIVVHDEDSSDGTSSYTFSPKNLWLFTILSVLGIVVLVAFLMVFTPLRGLVYDRPHMRQSVIEMQQQVAALQDSMEARNMQLKNLQRMLFTGESKSDDSRQKQGNTAFKENTNIEGDATGTKQPTFQHEFKLTKETVVISKLLQEAGSFPSQWPVEGTLTRKYGLKEGHYGIDIAAPKGKAFHAIADGMIIGKNWTLNYGYVLYVQHSNQIVTIYKHATEIVPDIGDLVLQGDILGRVGSTGIISSGPHLHMEIWMNGIPQNPLQYIVDTQLTS